MYHQHVSSQILDEAKKRAAANHKDKPAATATKPTDSANQTKTPASTGAKKTSTGSSLKKTETINVMGIPLEMKLIEGGSFLMGDDFVDNQKPVHRETVKTFYMGKTEVTQELWEAVMGYNPSDCKGSRLPIQKVSWIDCQRFINKLNKITGKYFRLPTEAEWEYALRGHGTYVNVDDSWHNGNAGGMPHQVGTKQPNSDFGIYDMYGNLWEWCQDRGAPNYYSDRSKEPLTNSMIRGNCFADPKANYAGERQIQPIGLSHPCIGFRLALEASPKVIIPNGVYYINTFENQNLTLDNVACRVAEFNNIQIWHKKNEDNKKWRVVNHGDGSISLHVMQNNDFIVQSLNIPESHQNVTLYGYLGTDNHKWIPEKAGNAYILRNKANPNFVLTVSNSNIAPDTNVEVNEYSGANGQKWVFERID